MKRTLALNNMTVSKEALKQASIHLTPTKGGSGGNEDEWWTREQEKGWWRLLFRTLLCQLLNFSNKHTHKHTWIPTRREKTEAFLRDHFPILLANKNCLCYLHDLFSCVLTLWYRLFNLCCCSLITGMQRLKQPCNHLWSHLCLFK